MTKSTAIASQDEKAIIETKEVLAAKQDVLLKLGQAQAFNFTAKLLTVSELKLLQEIKESKQYKGLTYTDENGKLLTVSNWGECCASILGASQQHVDEKLTNLKQFGEEFFEASQRMKLGYRDLRALRQLPADEQAAIIESDAVETGDKEAVKELIDDLKAKHKKELSASKKELKDNQDQLAAARKMRDDFQAKANQYQEELETSKFKANNWKETTKHLLFEATKYESHGIEALSRLTSLREHFLDNSDLQPQQQEYIAAAILNSFKVLAEDYAQAWLLTSNMLEGYLPKMRPALDVLEELSANAESE